MDARAGTQGSLPGVCVRGRQRKLGCWIALRSSLCRVQYRHIIARATGDRCRGVCSYLVTTPKACVYTGSKHNSNTMPRKCIRILLPPPSPKRRRVDNDNVPLPTLRAIVAAGMGPRQQQQLQPTRYPRPFRRRYKTLSLSSIPHGALLAGQRSLVHPVTNNHKNKDTSSSRQQQQQNHNDDKPRTRPMARTLFAAAPRQEVVDLTTTTSTDDSASGCRQTR